MENDIKPNTNLYPVHAFISRLNTCGNVLIEYTTQVNCANSLYSVNTESKLFIKIMYT